MSKSVKYGFKTTMREFCKYLAKQGIENIEPVSIFTDDTGSTIFYDEILESPDLKMLYGAIKPPFEDDSLKILPSTPTSLEKELWEILGPHNKLVEKLVGAYWRFTFDPETHILISLARGEEIYYRTTSIRQFMCTEEDPGLVFFRPTSRWEAKIVELTHFVRLEEKYRRYEFLIRGHEYYDLNINGAITSENSDDIGWYVGSID